MNAIWMKMSNLDKVLFVILIVSLIVKLGKEIGVHVCVFLSKREHSNCRCAFLENRNNQYHCLNLFHKRKFAQNENKCMHSKCLGFHPQGKIVDSVSSSLVLSIILSLCDWVFSVSSTILVIRALLGGK